MEPLDQVDQPPTDNPVDRRDRTALDNLHKRLALRIVEQRRFARSLAVEQPIRPIGVEANNPVPDNLSVTLPTFAASLRLLPS
jgi:hypothetical protein